MPVHSYHCKYCHQQKNTQTALNRHIAHTPKCFKAWQHDILNLSSTNTGVDRRANHRSPTSEEQPEILANDFVDEASSPGRSVSNNFQPSFVPLSDEVDEDMGVGQPQPRYRASYPGGDTAEILGEGKTKFQQWREEKNLKSENDWAPFENQKEWDLAQWLMRNVGQKSIDEYLKLPIVSLATDLHVNHSPGFRFRTTPFCHFIILIHS